MLLMVMATAALSFLIQKQAPIRGIGVLTAILHMMSFFLPMTQHPFRQDNSVIQCIVFSYLWKDAFMYATEPIIEYKFLKQTALLYLNLSLNRTP